MSNVSFGGVSGFSFPSAATVGSGSQPGGAGFGDVLKSAVTNVEKANETAATQVSNLLQGGNADINGVMIAVEKADVSFQLMMQVRNKIVNAYQEIEKMQF
jgi:flagellar hook-basal body complex protein FliE